MKPRQLRAGFLLSLFAVQPSRTSSTEHPLPTCWARRSRVGFQIVGGGLTESVLSVRPLGQSRGLASMRGPDSTPGGVGSIQNLPLAGYRFEHSGRPTAISKLSNCPPTRRGCQTIPGALEVRKNTSKYALIRCFENAARKRLHRSP